MKRNKTRRFTVLRMLRNQKGVALIWSYLLSVSLLTMLTSFYTVTAWDIRNLAVEGQRTQAFYLAEAGIDKMLAQVKTGNYNAINSTTLGTAGTYDAVYDSSARTITATGHVGALTKTIVATVNGIRGTVPPGVSAAITGGNIDLSGKLTIDGNNYNDSGTALNNGRGLPGIASSGTIRVWSNNVLIGDQYNAPSNPAAPAVARTLTSSSTFDSINAVFGLNSSSTTLTQNPNTSAPKSTFTKALYFFNPDLTNGTPTADLSGSSGLFIVRVAGGEVVLTGGTFTGLVVVDGADTITLDKLTINGGLVVTNTGATTHVVRASTDDPTKVGGTIHFSEKVLTSFLPSISGASFQSAHPFITNWADSSNNAGVDRITYRETNNGTGSMGTIGTSSDTPPASD